jgi:hypothetical protein
VIVVSEYIIHIYVHIPIRPSQHVSACVCFVWRAKISTHTHKRIGTLCDDRTRVHHAWVPSAPYPARARIIHTHNAHTHTHT